MALRSHGLHGLALAAAAAALAFGGCDGGCEIGETWCEETRVMVCVEDPDDDAFEDEDGPLIDLIELVAVASDADTIGVEQEDCAKRSKVCVELEDEAGSIRAECDWEDIF